MDFITISHSTQSRFIREKRNFELNMLTLNMRNLPHPLETRLTPPNSQTTVTLQEILSQGKVSPPPREKQLFHSVVPHGLIPNTVILASLKAHKRTLWMCKRDLTKIIQGMFPWICDSNISENTCDKQAIIVGMEKLEFHERSAICVQVEEMFDTCRDNNPEISDDNQSPGSPESLHMGAWSNGPQKIKIYLYETDPKDLSDSNDRVSTRKSRLHKTRTSQRSYNKIDQQQLEEVNDTHQSKEQDTNLGYTHTRGDNSINHPSVTDRDQPTCCTIS